MKTFPQSLQYFLLSSVALLCLFAATPVLADNSGKIYVGGDLGASTFSNASDFPDPGVIRLVLGVRLGANLAAEAGYSEFSDSSHTYAGSGGRATLSSRAYQVVAIGSLPLSSLFDLTGKIGFTQNNGKLSSTAGVNDEYTCNCMILGAGAQYHLSSLITLRLQYDDYGNFYKYSPAIGATAVTLGVLFDF